MQQGRRPGLCQGKTATRVRQGACGSGLLATGIENCKLKNANLRFAMAILQFEIWNQRSARVS
jgi:hypothetical protein